MRRVIHGFTGGAQFTTPQGGLYETKTYSVAFPLGGAPRTCCLRHYMRRPDARDPNVISLGMIFIGVCAIVVGVGRWLYPFAYLNPSGGPTLLERQELALLSLVGGILLLLGGIVVLIRARRKRS